MGVIEDIADNYSRAQMLGLGIGFMILPILAVLLRIWAKRLARKGVSLDDYLITAGATFAVACCIVQIIAAVDGQLGQHQTVDAHGQPILDDPKFIVYEKTKFAANLLSTIGLGFVKSSILVFYLSIFRGRAFKLATQGLLFIVVAWSVSFFFANLFTCYPITPYVEPFYGHKCINAVPMWFGMAVSDFVIDCLILVIPIPNVLKLQLPWKQKIGVIGMFLTGTSVLAFSLTRTLMYYHVAATFEKHYNDETYYTSPVFFWAVIELSTAVLCACLPLYRPLWFFLRRQSMSSHDSNSSMRSKTILIEKGEDGRVSQSKPIGDPEENVILTTRTYSVEHMGSNY